MYNSVCSCAYSLWLPHTNSVLAMFGMPRHDPLVSRSYKNLDFCDKNWTGSSEMWFYNGKHLMTVEALHEVTHWARNVTAVLDCSFVFKNAKHYHALGWMTFPRNCLWLLYNCFCVCITVLRNHLWWPSTINGYMWCLPKGEPRLDVINTWLWN